PLPRRGGSGAPLRGRTGDLRGGAGRGVRNVGPRRRREARPSRALRGGRRGARAPARGFLRPGGGGPDAPPGVRARARETPALARRGPSRGSPCGRRRGRGPRGRDRLTAYSALRRSIVPESTTPPAREIAVKYSVSPEISAARNALSVSNPLAVIGELLSMSPTASCPPDPTTKWTIPCCGFTRSKK